MGCGGSKANTVVENQIQPEKKTSVVKDGSKREGRRENDSADGQSKVEERINKKTEKVGNKLSSHDNKAGENIKDVEERIVGDNQPRSGEAEQKIQANKSVKSKSPEEGVRKKESETIDNKARDDTDQAKPVTKNKLHEEKEHKNTSVLAQHQNVTRSVPPPNASDSPPSPPFGNLTESPFDPSVNVGKYRTNPIPVFGRDAFPLSKNESEMRIEDTFWPGKRSLIPDYGKMKRLDQHAIETPKRLRSSISDLVSHLTKIANTDLEKFRVIFRWIAHNVAYDVAGFQMGRIGDNSAEAVLKSGIAVCEGYSELLLVMCAKSGLQCDKITGHAKGSGYEPSLKNLTKVTHAWNRVTLNGQTFYSDCTWAAGNVDSKNGKAVFKRQWTEQMFLSEPQSFAARHFPRDPRDQVCPSPYTSFDQWNDEPHMGALARFTGLELLTHKDGVIQAPDNEFLIRFRLERALYKTFCRIENEAGKRMNCVAQHWWRGNEVSCHIRLPKAGKYTFMFLGRIVDGKSTDDEEEEMLFLTDPAKALESLLVTYTIKATGNQAVKPMSNEQNVDLFGAPLNLPKAGLMPVTENLAAIKAPGGQAHVVYQKIQRGPSRIQVELHSFKEKDKELSSSVYCEQFDDWVVCHIRCPLVGKYALNLWVKGTDNGPSCSIRYTILSEGDITPVSLPVIHGMAGPHSNFEKLDLRLRDALTSTIVTKEGEATLAVQWDLSKDVMVAADLIQEPGSKSLKEEGNVIVETKREQVGSSLISIRLKKKGVYKLALFAKNSAMTDKIFVGHWLVVCRKPCSKDPYPLKAPYFGPSPEFSVLGLETPTQSRIKCVGGEGVMEVYGEPDAFIEYAFSLSRTEEDEKKGKIFADTVVENGRRVVRFEFRMRSSGLFAFRLFAKPQGAAKYMYVGVWLVDSDAASKRPSFPGVRGSYGPNEVFHKSGLQVDEALSKKIDLRSGEGELRLNHKTGTNRRITARLESGNGTYKQNPTSLLIEGSLSDKGEMVSTQLRIRLKDPGLYDLVVFAENKDGTSFDYVGVWLVDCAKATSKARFPESQGSMGPRSEFFNMGLSVQGPGPSCSTIRATKNGICSLVVQRDKPFEVIFKESSGKCDISVTESQDGKHGFTCTAKLPRHDLYVLKFFASDPEVNIKDFMGSWLLDWDK